MHQYYISEPIPLDNPSPVLKIVGKTFVSLGERFGYETLINFGTSNCEACERLDNLWLQLAKDCWSIPNLKIASFDVLKNEVPNLTIDSIPAIVLIKKGELITYKGDLDLLNIKDFLT